MTRLITSFVGLVAFLALTPPLTAQTDGMGPPTTVVYLVRHAERAEDGTNDPPVSQAGEERARLLARMLGDAGIERIHSTDYRRTRATAAPLADRLGLQVESYDPRDLRALAARLQTEGGRHLVVGHSNTTPDAVRALGGAPGDPIHESEYDRLYIVVVTGDGVTTELVRFGTPFPGP